MTQTKGKNSNTDKKLSTILRHGLFAGLASSTSILSYPLEVLKIRSHVLEDKHFTKNLITRMYKEEGSRSFYKGLNQNLLHGFFGYGTVFFIYELVHDKLHKNDSTSGIINAIIASTLGGMIAVTFTSPINFVKTRQILYKETSELENEKNKMSNIIKDIYKENQSIRAFWKALNPSIITSFYAAIQISLYQIFKKKFIKKEEENLKLNSMLGMISRCVACTLIFPFSLLRSRILNYSSTKNIDELTGSNAAGSSLTNNSTGNNQANEYFYQSKYKYQKIIGDIKGIIHREGYFSLFRGLKFELIKVSINGALFFYMYELLNKKYN
jgi:hypothetical protein